MLLIKDGYSANVKRLAPVRVCSGTRIARRAGTRVIGYVDPTKDQRLVANVEHDLAFINGFGNNVTFVLRLMGAAADNFDVVMQAVGLLSGRVELSMGLSKMSLLGFEIVVNERVSRKLGN